MRGVGPLCDPINLILQLSYGFELSAQFYNLNLESHQVRSSIMAMAEKLNGDLAPSPEQLKPKQNNFMVDEADSDQVPAAASLKESQSLVGASLSTIATDAARLQDSEANQKSQAVTEVD